MGNKIELGQMSVVTTCTVARPDTMDERMDSLEKKFNVLMKFNESNLNGDGIPLGTSLLGNSVKNGIQILSVNQDGKYCIGASTYDSLSSAAEAASGIRQPGELFWKTTDGRTVKEVYNNNGQT